MVRGKAIRRTTAAARFAASASWEAGRLRTIGVVGIPLLQSVLPAALALVLRGLVNAAVETVGSGQSGAGELGLWVLLSFSISVLLALTQSAQQYVQKSNLEALELRESLDVIAHAGRLDFAKFEDPQFHDIFRFVGQNPGQHVHEMLARSTRVVASLVTVVSLVVILLRIEARVLLYFLPLTLPYLGFRSWEAKRRVDIARDQTRAKRWAGYFTTQVTSGEALPEVRSLDLEPLFVRKLSSVLGSLRDTNERTHRIEAAGSIAFNVLAVVVVHIALYQASVSVVNGNLTVGDIAIFATAAAGLRTALDGFVISIAGTRWNVAHLVHLQSFFSLEPAREEIASPPRRHQSSSKLASLIVDDVSFSYPGASSPILDGLTFTVEPGETVALVGRNGSGKSTLVKLIAGLYPAQSGSIRLGDLDVDSASPREVRDSLSIVFQQYGRFMMSAGENIAVGDWPTLLEDPDTVEAIASRVGIDGYIRSLPNGYDTVLGRMFGDVTPSGGQWQSIAIARAFTREAPIMILDEPTANLDAEAEFEAFAHFKELAQGRTTLLISHRFSTLALADRIVVLEDGRAIEQGTHGDLMRVDGTYARLYRLYRNQDQSDDW